MPGELETSNLTRGRLVRSRAVQLTTGVVFIAGGLVAVAGFALTERPLAHAIPCLIAGLIVGLIVLVRPPTPVDSPWNHALLAAVYGVPALAYYGALPDASATVPAFIFAGALIPFRLTDRRPIAAHLLATSAVLLAPFALGLADKATLFAVAVLILGMNALASIVLIVLEAAGAQSEELERLVRRDPLTGVGNRRLLAERLNYELLRHRRSGQPLSLLAFDLNGFKQVNDQHGHAAGDDLLVAVADALNHGSRAQDTVVRQGGDEFCVLLPETTRAGAQQVARTLRESLAAVTAGELPITTGLGIATYPADGNAIDDLLRVADERLRADKLPSDQIA